MNPEEFVKWLDELLKFNPNLKELDQEQTKIIKEKLDQVFIKMTPRLSCVKTPTYCVQEAVKYVVSSGYNGTYGVAGHYNIPSINATKWLPTC